MYGAGRAAGGLPPELRLREHRVGLGLLALLHLLEHQKLLMMPACIRAAKEEAHKAGTCGHKT